jgi:hypothetical protein
MLPKTDAVPEGCSSGETLFFLLSAGFSSLSTLALALLSLGVSFSDRT